MSQVRMEDKYEAEMQENFAVLQSLHDGCYTKCSKRSDISYMTMGEGICFRNCLNKFNNWYPRFGEQTQDAAFRTYWDLTEQLEREIKRN